MSFFREGELAIEHKVRSVGCPVCLVAPGRACRYATFDGKQILPQSAAHTGRYNVAAEAGIVPPISAKGEVVGQRHTPARGRRR